MLAQLPYDETFIISVWLEVLLYGIYFSLFWGSLFIVLRKRDFSNMPSRVMFISMIIMFFLATLHVGVNFYRLLQGYVWNRDAPGGPPAYFTQLARWDHVFVDTIYATQSIIGDGLAIYRCWVVWHNNYYIIALPAVLLVCSIISGYMTCWLFTQVSSASVFDPRLQKWVTVFYSIAVAQNLITTGLIAHHIWRRDRAFGKALDKPVSGRASLMPIVRVVVESAAIYVAAELILLVLYALNLNAQYILLELITPTVGIVFTSITVRLALRNTKSASGTAVTVGAPVTFPMLPLSVHVTRNIRKDRDEADDQQSFSADKTEEDVHMHIVNHV